MELDERKKKRTKRHARDKYRVHYVGGIGYGPLWNNGALYPSTDPHKHKKHCPHCPDSDGSDGEGEIVNSTTSNNVGGGSTSVGESVELNEGYDIVSILRECVYKWFATSERPEFARCFIMPDGTFVSTMGRAHGYADNIIFERFNYVGETGDLTQFIRSGIDITPDQIEYIINQLEVLFNHSTRNSGSDIIEDLLGAIRCNGEFERYMVIDQEISPTPRQYKSLLSWLIKYYEPRNDYFSVTTSGTKGGYDTEDSIKYIVVSPEETNADDIIKAIKRYYVSGELREQIKEEIEIMYDIKNAFKALKDIEDINLEDYKPSKFERESLAEKYMRKPLKEDVKNPNNIKKLEPKFDSRKSFYGKARVATKADGTKVLWSYNTPVCRIKDGKVTLLRRGYLGWSSSPTTLRHVKDFLQQNGFEAGSYKDIAKRYPEEQAGISEGLVEEWKGPHVVEPGSKEYENLRLACEILNKESVHSISYELETTYLDYGQNWKYTAIIAHDPHDNIWGGSWQVGSPRNWEEIANADSEEEVRAAVDDLKMGEYFQDVPEGAPKHGPMKNYTLSDLEVVDDIEGNTVYKVDGKFSLNPNINIKRFDTIDDLKKFLIKRGRIKEAANDSEKLAFEWFSNELESNHDLWDEENHAYDLDKVNTLIDNQEEWDKDMLRWFFKQMSELDDSGYDYDNFVMLCGHYDKPLKESTNIDLTNKEDLSKAREILNDDTDEDENKEVIVDVDADSVEALKKSYAGQVILQCQKCFTPRFISAEELVKTEEKDEDGKFIYNIEDECPQCGEKAGYIVAGQVSKFDSEASKEAEEENTNPEDMTPVDSEAPDMDILFDEEPEIEEESFNRVFTNYLTETYSNVKSFNLESGTFEGKRFVLEGKIQFESGKTKTINLVFEGRKSNNMLVLESIKDNITGESKSFIIEALINGNTFTTKSLKYSYKAADQLVEGLVK